MDQKIIARADNVSGSILIFCAFLCLGPGIFIIMGYPRFPWPVGLVLIICGFVTGYSGIKQLRTSLKKSRTNNKQIHSPRIITGKKNHRTKDDDVLACWHYTPEEWKQFYRWERKKRKINGWLESIIIIPGGSVFIYYSWQGQDWISAFLLSVVAAIIYGIGKYYLTMAPIGMRNNSWNEIMITHNAIFINGKPNPFLDETRRKGIVQIIEEPDPKVLKITYHWTTKNGESSDEIRIPIPKGKLGEAVRLMDLI